MQSITQATNVMLSFESNEYGTPAHIIERARTVLGTIDLDPASSPEFNKTIGAKRFLTEHDNGLRYNWRGTVWLNPPYGKTGKYSNQAIWARHLETQYVKGNVTSALLLIRAQLGYDWFEAFWRNWTCCLVRKRIAFLNPNGTTNGEAKYASAIFYFGLDNHKFIDLFGSIGRILLP